MLYTAMELLVLLTHQRLTEQPDEKLWLRNLLASDAQYLLVGRQPVLRE